MKKIKLGVIFFLGVSFLGIGIFVLPNYSSVKKSSPVISEKLPKALVLKGEKLIAVDVHENHTHHAHKEQEKEPSEDDLAKLAAELPDLAEPFIPENTAQEFDNYLEKLLSEGPDRLPSEGIEEFNKRLSATIDASEVARHQYVEMFRTSDSPMIRMLLEQAIAYSPHSTEILLQEANHILETDNSELYPEMFELYSRHSEKLDNNVLEKAFDFLVANADDPNNSVGALNYLAKVNTPYGEGVSLIHRGVAQQTLDYLVTNSSDDTVKMVALRHLFNFSSPTENAEIAIRHITDNFSSKSVIIETLSSIGYGHVRRNDNLDRALHNALKEKELSPEEQELVSEVLFSTSPSEQVGEEPEKFTEQG